MTEIIRYLLVVPPPAPKRHGRSRLNEMLVTGFRAITASASLLPALVQGLSTKPMLLNRICFIGCSGQVFGTISIGRNRNDDVHAVPARTATHVNPARRNPSR